MPTVYWLAEGDEAEEWALCTACYAEAASEVMIVPGQVTAWGTCRSCGEWFSVRELLDAKPGGRRSAPSGTCGCCSAWEEDGSME